MSDLEVKMANDTSMSGFGVSKLSEVEELSKALSISQNYGATAPGNLTGGSALSVEDLDATLKLVTFNLQHLRLWKDIIKQQVTQTVSEYNVQNSYGQEVSPFFAMGGNPTSTDANYDREYITVKYLGTQGQVQHNLTLIQAAHGPVVAREVKNKTVELLGRNERAMFDADSSINALEYDGIMAQVQAKEASATYKSSDFADYTQTGADDSVIMDIRGSFDEDVAEDMALRNVNNFGFGMDCYLGTTIHSQFSKDFYLRQRTVPGASVTSGNRVKEHMGSLDFRYKPSLFNLPRKSPKAVSVSASTAPTLANVTTPANAASEFGAADAGSYGYVVSLVYSDGETLPSANTTTTVAAGDIVQIEVSFTGTPLYANVFRVAGSATTGHQFIKRVALGASGANITIDTNSDLPGAAKAYLVEHNEDVLVWKQLGSMIKYDLAVTDTSYKWLQLMYGTPLVAAARKVVIAKNII